jgi:ferredoxin-NADP reductase
VKAHAETIPVVVTEIEQVTPLIKLFTLRSPDGSDLPAFSGGCHIVVIMPCEGRTHRNPYSLLSSPWDLSRYQIAVRRHENGRGGSLYLHDRVEVGMQLRIAHPINLFPLARLARKHILIGGGVGITPLLAMVEDLKSGCVPFEAHYSMRDPEHAYFGLHLQQQLGERLTLYYSSRGERIDFARVLSGQPLGTHVYICGPTGLLEGAVRAAQTAGWTDSHIHFEKFSAPPVGAPFDVYLADSGLSVHVPSEMSLLEAIEAAGVDAPYLCRGGACGECETEVLELEGELLHNDHWLSDEDRASGKKIMPCISRASCMRLVLKR